jgi:hypothetical protein
LWFTAGSGGSAPNLGFGVAMGRRPVKYRIWWGGGSWLGGGGVTTAVGDRQAVGGAGGGSCTTEGKKASTSVEGKKDTGSHRGRSCCGVEEGAGRRRRGWRRGHALPLSRDRLCDRGLPFGTILFVLLRTFRMFQSSNRIVYI